MDPIQYFSRYFYSGFPSLPIAHPSPPDLESYLGSLSSYQSSSDHLASEANQVVTDVKNQIARQIANPDPATLQRLSQINEQRRAKGQAPINLQQTIGEIEAIQNRTDLSAKQKKKQIDQIRKQLGIGKKDFKALFTNRLAKIYDQAAKRLEQFQRVKMNQLQGELQLAEKMYGKNSPQVQDIRRNMDALHRAIEPQKQQFSQKSKFYKNMYPSFWSKVGGFLKKIAGGIFKGLSLLKSIPAFGSLFNVAGRIITPLKHLFTGKIGSFFKSLGSGILDSIRDIKPFLPLIPGVGPVASLVAQGIDSIRGAIRNS